jgi:membrane protein implicated in regulation of membrane protease activity
MAADIFFGIVILVLLIAMLQGFFVLLAVYPQVAFGLVLILSFWSLYYDLNWGRNRRNR